jgi:hypothetical protein
MRLIMLPGPVSGSLLKLNGKKLPAEPIASDIHGGMNGQKEDVGQTAKILLQARLLWGATLRG